MLKAGKLFRVEKLFECIEYCYSHNEVDVTDVLF